MSLELFNLNGKVALITGGTHGLGMAIANGLGAAGARLVINGHTPSKMAEAIYAYKKEGFDATGYIFDVSNEEAVIKGIKQIESEVGPIDILVNNAGIIKRIPLKEMSVADFSEVINIDLIAAFIMSKHVVKGMIARGHGKIINQSRCKNLCDGHR